MDLQVRRAADAPIWWRQHETGVTTASRRSEEETDRRTPEWTSQGVVQPAHDSVGSEAVEQLRHGGQRVQEDGFRVG